MRATQDAAYPAVVLKVSLGFAKTARQLLIEEASKFSVSSVLITKLDTKAAQNPMYSTALEPEG